jgi:UDP:flavonoid glycosyltransferase YjiC (YdhE family)
MSEPTTSRTLEIRRVLQSPSIQERARAVAASMKQEDGVQRAVTLIEQRLARG